MADFELTAEQLLLAFESARASTWVWDIAADQVIVHPVADTVLGGPASGERRSRADWFEMVHPEDREEMTAAVQRSLLSGEAFRLHYRVRDSSGTWVWIAVRAGIRRDAGGVPVEMVGVAIDITEQKRAELNLGRREYTFSRLVNSVDGIVWEADGNTFQFLFVSRAAERILGFPLEEWTQIPDFWVRHLHPEDAQWCIEFCLQAARAEQDHSFEYRMIAQDGRVVWLHDVVTVRREPGGLIRLRGVMLDITARKQAEQSQRESEAHFKLLFEQSSAGLCVFDNAGEKVQVNSAYCNFLGRTEAEVMSTSFVEKVHPGDRELAGRILETLRRGEVANEEVRFIRGDGECVWGRLTASRASIGGRLSKGISIVQDITGQKRAEAILKQSQEHFRTVANDTPAFIWMTSADGQNAFINRSLAAFFGVDSDVLPRGHFEYVHPDDLQRVRESFDAAIRGRRPSVHETRIRRFDGEYRWILNHTMPRFSAAREFLGHVGSGTDITERKLAEQELRDAHDRLAEELKVRARLQQELSGLSERMIHAQEEERRRVAGELHDGVGNQIAALTIALANLNRESPSVQTQLATKMLRDLAQGIRDISHQLHPVMLEYAGLAPALREMCGEYAALTGMKVAVAAPEDLGQIPCEIALCAYRVTQEALQNIAKHSGVMEAEVSLARLGGYLCLTISDRGNGFDPEAACQGGGLGLISIRERIRLVRGLLKIDSGPGRGTVVKVGVPLDS